MRPIEILDHAPTHAMTFDEFASHALVACVRSGSNGCSVVDVDAPGWVGLAELRMEASRAFGAMGYTRSTAQALTTRLVTESLASNFAEDCKSFRLEPGRSVIYVKEGVANGLGVRDILRRVYAATLSAVEMSRPQPQSAASTADADALC